MGRSETFSGDHPMVDEEKRRETLERVRRMAERHAMRKGFALQPDSVQLDYVLGGLAENWMTYSKPYCPCRPVTGDEEKDRLNICPCRSHREEIAKFGECECSLFVRDGNNPGKE